MTILVVTAWFAYRLSEGPLSLSFLSPYIEDALTSPDGRFAVKVEHTVLVWNRDTGSLQIRASQVRAISGEQGVIAAVPEMSLSLSGPALLHGLVAPRSLKLLHPSVRMVRDAQGHFRFGLGSVEETGANSSPAVAEAFQALLAPPSVDTPAGQLQRIEVVGGDMVVEDQVHGTRWHTPDANLRFTRDHQGIGGHARIELIMDGEPARFDADGHYRNDEKVVDATLSFGGIRPSVLAELVPELQPLNALQLPIGGNVRVRYAVERGLTDLHFDIAGGEGVVDMSSQLGVSWPVASLALRGVVSEGASRVALDELRVDLGGPLVTVAGLVEGIGGDMKMNVAARVDELPVDDLKGLWPPVLAPNPRAWIFNNLSHGVVHSATAQLAAHLPAGKPAAELVVDSVGGKVVPEGVTVRYLDPMPAVKNVRADAHFDADSFVLDIKSGEVTGLKVQEGKVALTGLSDANQFAEIGLKIVGPVDDALRLIDSKPLEWSRKLGVDPARVKGDAVTQLDLRFPLLANLSFAQLKVHAQAQTSRLVIPGVALGLDLNEGNLGLQVDQAGLDVSGKALLGGQPADIKWRENFGKAPFRSRYLIKGIFGEQARKAAGLQVAPFVPPFLDGAVPIELTATLTDSGKGDIDIKADLTPAAMGLPGLNWDKPAGTAGQAQANLRLAGNRLADVPNFSMTTADGAELQGQVAFDNGRARRVVFRKAKWGRTDVKGSLTIKPDGSGLLLDVSGSSLDGRELVSGRPSDHKTDKAAPRPERPAERVTPDKREEVTPMTVQAHFGQVWVTDDGTVKNVVALLSRDTHDWQQARIDAAVGPENKPLRIDLMPVSSSRRSLKVTSSDAGALFRSFGVFENVVGGQFVMDGVFDDADPRQPLTGTARVEDYQVVKAPALARLLTVAALTGVVELLSGDGIHFSTLDVPFTLTDGVLEVRDARAYGTSLGITAKGQMDLDNNVLALEGTVVPIYVLNSVLGQIPVVGSLFAAEKGGGVFAMNYSMKGPAEDPTVTVNPLSALTPGFLRKLFNIFDDGSETKVRPKAETPKPAAPAN